MLLLLATGWATGAALESREVGSSPGGLALNAEHPTAHFSFGGCCVGSPCSQ